MTGYTVNFQINGGSIQCDTSVLAADSTQFVTAGFCFDASWENLLKTAVFRFGEKVYHVVLENDLCKFPPEVLCNGMCYVSVFGVLNSTRATTVEVGIQVEKSGYIKVEPQAQTPDPYNYFLQAATAQKQAAEAAAAEALESKTAAQNAADAAAEQNNAAYQNAQSSAQSAALAENYSEAAKQCAAGAEAAKAAAEAAAKEAESSSSLTAKLAYQAGVQAAAAKSSAEAAESAKTACEAVAPTEISAAELNVTQLPQTASGFYKALDNLRLVREAGNAEVLYIPKGCVFSVLKSYPSEIGGDYTYYEVHLFNSCLLNEYEGQISPYSTGCNYFYARTLLGTEIEYTFASSLATASEISNKINTFSQKQNAASAQQFCGALKGSSCGTTLRLDDVSPIEHSIRLKASSKNLLDTAKCLASQYFKITEKANGAITVTDTNSVNRQPVLEFLRNVLLPAGSYTFSCNFSLENVPTKADGADTTRLNELIVFVDGTYKAKTDAITADGSYYKELSFTLSKPSVVRIAWYRNINDITPADSTYKAAFSNIQLEKSAAATAYTPYISNFSTTKIRAAGKNLIDCRLWKNSATTCGVTVQYLEDEDCFVLNGTATRTLSLGQTDIDPIPCKNIAFGFSANYLSGNISYPAETSYAVLYLGEYNSNGTFKNAISTENFATVNSSFSKTLTSADMINRAWFFISAGVCFENYKVRVQLELGSAATEYEPYSAAACTVNSNGEAAGVLSRYPVTSFIAENPGVVLTAEYNRDVNRAFADLQQAIISLGGNV